MPERGPMLTTGSPPPDEETWESGRRDMLLTLRRHGVTDPRVLEAMARIARHRFIPEAYRRAETAYADHPVEIGGGQTISQPFIVAYMTERLAVQPGQRILEIGTGSGYQAAVLAEMGAVVFSIEYLAGLAEHARHCLAAEGYAGRVSVRHGDGHAGWPEESPFDAILTACAPVTVPQCLVDQLGDGGRMILPVGSQWGFQRLVFIRKTEGRLDQADDLPVRFVPMVGG